MFKLRFHPTFWLLAVALVIQEKHLYLFAAVIASVLHELGHARAAYNRGYMLQRITIMPYGALLYGAEQISQDDSFAIAAAGPLTNIFIAISTIALWWIFPSTYPYTQIFCRVNLMIAVFNLLPFYPLDGSRIVLSFVKNKLKVLKILRMSGVIFSLVLLSFFILSIFIKINFSILVMSIMVFVSAISGTQKESYAHIASFAPYTKNLENPLALKTLYINHNLPLIKLLRQIRTTHITEFIIIDDDMNVIGRLCESELTNLCLNNNCRTRIKEINLIDGQKKEV